MASKRAWSTQRLVNTYPLWSNIRNDDQSLGFQLFNYAAGTHLDDMFRQLADIRSNYYLSTSITSDIDVFYTVELPESYDFTKLDDDDTELLYITPTVSGEIGTNSYPVLLSSGNSIESFWNEAIPSRIELGVTTSGQHLLFSGYVIESPFIPLVDSGIPHITNNLTITMSGASSYYDYIEGQAQIGLVQIDGSNREDIELTEENFVLHDTTFKTLHEFSTVSGMRVYNVDEPESTFIWVKSADFNNTHYKTSYDLGWSINGQPAPFFWSLSTPSEINYSTTIDLVRYDVESLDTVLTGNFVDRSPILRIEILNQANTPVTLLDITPEPYSDRIWAVSSSTLYCFNSYLPYVDTSKLTLKQYDAASKIETSAQYLIRNEEFTLDYVWVRPTIGVIKHRVWAEYPNGSKYSVIEGSITTYTTGEDSWDWGEPVTRYLRASDTFTLTLPGNYIFTLEVHYADGTSSIDQRILSVLTWNPAGEWDLPSIGVYRDVVGIDIDGEGKLWVLNDQGGTHEIVFHYDNMLIDWKEKTVYLREQYDQVRVL